RRYPGTLHMELIGQTLLCPSMNRYLISFPAGEKVGAFERFPSPRVGDDSLPRIHEYAAVLLFASVPPKGSALCASRAGGKDPTYRFSFCLPLLTSGTNNRIGFS